MNTFLRMFNVYFFYFSIYFETTNRMFILLDVSVFLFVLFRPCHRTGYVILKMTFRDDKWLFSTVMKVKLMLRKIIYTYKQTEKKHITTLISNVVTVCGFRPAHRRVFNALKGKSTFFAYIFPNMHGNPTHLKSKGNFISNSVCYHGLHTELLLDNFVEFVRAMCVFVELGLYA